MEILNFTEVKKIVKRGIQVGGRVGGGATLVLLGAADFQPVNAANTTDTASNTEAWLDSGCNGQLIRARVLGLGVEYLDLAQPDLFPFNGRKDIFDKGTDPWAGPAFGGMLTVMSTDRTVILGEGNWVAQAPKITDVILPQLKENVAFAYIEKQVPCNTTVTRADGKIVPAVKVFLNSSQDSDNWTFPAILPDSAVVPVWYGRMIKSPEAFLKMVDRGDNIRDLKPATLDQIREAVRKAKVIADATTIAAPSATARARATATQVSIATATARAIATATRAPIATATAQAENQARVDAKARADKAATDAAEAAEAAEADRIKADEQVRAEDTKKRAAVEAKARQNRDDADRNGWAMVGGSLVLASGLGALAWRRFHP